MRRFHSYGPIDLRHHFGVKRRALVDLCVDQLVGPEGAFGHFFTLWAPRQTGKTWLMHRAVETVRQKYGDRYEVGVLSMQGLSAESDAAFFDAVPGLFREGLGLKPPAPTGWPDWYDLFAVDEGAFDRPLILLIDEFDSLSSPLVDRLVAGFRRMYLARESYRLHGLALVGVRAVLGVESTRGSPFNVQKTLHVPNLTPSEVRDMFTQYQRESGQPVHPEVVEAIHAVTRGQPGLVGWLGELLTDKYNKTPTAPMTLERWQEVFMLASRVEPNNTVLNLIQKAKGPYFDQVLNLFHRPNVPFSFDIAGCNYLYTHGILDFERITPPSGEPTLVSRFSSPFIQLRLHAALTEDLVPHLPTLALSPLDDLSSVFSEGIDAPALCRRYIDYLERLKAAGRNPFEREDLRSDLGLREAVGHFHLYAWLREAVGDICRIRPEFPTGNGKVDLLLQQGVHQAVIEVKSFRNANDLKAARRQAARYAKHQNLSAATLAIFVPVDDATVLEALSTEETIDAVRVTTIAIGWIS